MTLTRRGSSRFYRCINWTTCKGSHGADPRGKPLGIEVPLRVRQLRQYAHEVAKAEWPWDDAEAKQRFYAWMRWRLNLPRPHIGAMQEGELLALVKRIEHHYYRKLGWPIVCASLCEDDPFRDGETRHAPVCHVFNRIHARMDALQDL